MRETTTGGLYLYPEIIIEGAEEPGATTPAKIKAVNDNAELQFETPISIGIHGIDSRNDLRLAPQSNSYVIQSDANNKTLLTDFQHDFTHFDSSTSHSIMFGNEGVIHEFSRADGNAFYNHIARKIQDNLANNSTNIQELTKYYQRDRNFRKKGFGGAQAIANTPDMRDYEDDYVFHELIINELNKVGKEPGQGGGPYRFREIVPNAIETFYQSYDINRDKNVIYDVAADLTRVLGSVMVHGVGAPNFLDTYLHAFNESLDNKKIAADRTDMFLGEDGTHPDVLGQRLRALPVTSDYHPQLIKNFYKENCY